MNEIEFDKTIKNLTEDLGEKYLKLNDLELAGYKNDKIKEKLIYGQTACSEARRIQEEFFPMAENSEEIMMMLLNQKFSYEGVDYSDEVDKMAVHNAEIGLFLYVANALETQISAIEELIGEAIGEEIF